MKKEHLSILLWIALLLSSTISVAQSKEQPYPKIGDQINDYTFTDIINYPGKTISINELKGKWALLDFWSSTCGGCIASFDKMNKLQNQFKDSVKVIMVGVTGESSVIQVSKKNTKYIYDLNAKKYNLKFTVAFDSAADDLFGIYGVPSIILVNPAGQIVAKTYNLDAADMQEILNGNMPELDYAYSRNEPVRKTYDFTSPLLAAGKRSNGGNDTSFLFRSMVTKWQKGMPEYFYYGFKGEFNRSYYQKYPNRAEIFGMDIPTMLRLGYTGYTSINHMLPIYDSIYNTVIIESVNRKIFEERNVKTNENSYCYSITLPNYDSNSASRCLIQDLERTFKFKSAIEVREVPVLKLVVIDQKKALKLKTKGGTPAFQAIEEIKGFKLINWKISDLVKGGVFRNALEADYGNDANTIPPIYDETGLSFNIDLVLKGYYKDFGAIRRGLNDAGLDLVPGKHPYNCIVVKDL